MLGRAPICLLDPTILQHLPNSIRYGIYVFDTVLSREERVGPLPGSDVKTEKSEKEGLCRECSIDF